MRMLGGIAVALTVAGCMTSNDERPPYFHPMEAYAQCNREAVRGLAARPGDPTPLALAAEQQCAPEFEVVTAALTEAKGAEWAASMGQDVRNRQIQQNLIEIGRARSRR